MPSRIRKRSAGSAVDPRFKLALNYLRLRRRDRRALVAAAPLSEGARVIAVPIRIHVERACVFAAPCCASRRVRGWFLPVCDFLIFRQMRVSTRCLDVS